MYMVAGKNLGRDWGLLKLSMGIANAGLWWGGSGGKLGFSVRVACQMSRHSRYRQQRASPILSMFVAVVSVPSRRYVMVRCVRAFWTAHKCSKILTV